MVGAWDLGPGLLHRLAGGEAWFRGLGRDESGGLSLPSGCWVNGSRGLPVYVCRVRFLWMEGAGVGGKSRWPGGPSGSTRSPLLEVGEEEEQCGGGAL